MGSKDRFSYDILGDEVNLAARLEGQTKNYGVSLILSKNTIDKLKSENV
jgi:adenylate cyclase